MLKIYSRGCEHALRLLTQLPRNALGKKFLAVDLCRKAKVPLHSSRKILQLLVERGYLAAVTGPGGGYQLKVDPRKITLLDIIHAIDGKDAFDHCIMGLPKCNQANACAIHATWKKLKGTMLAELQARTLDQLVGFSNPRAG